MAFTNAGAAADDEVRYTAMDELGGKAVVAPIPHGEDDASAANGSGENFTTFHPWIGPNPTTAAATAAKHSAGSQFLAVAIAVAFAVVTLLLVSFTVAVRCRLSAILQGFLWKERYNTQLKISYILRPEQLAEMAWRTATCWLRRVPDVHIVGCMKCGTTALNAYMQQHPGVESPDKQFVKEVHFTAGRSVFRGDFEDCPWLYRSFFAVRTPLDLLRSVLPKRLADAVLPAEAARPIQMDATPQRVFLPWAPRFYKKISPNAKIIVCLRDPVKRAVSHWQMERGRSKETRDFATAIDEELTPEVDAWYKYCMSPDPLTGKHTIQHAVKDCEYAFPLLDFAYARRGMAHAAGVRRWVQEYGRENVLIITQDDLSNDPKATMDRVFKHVGLPPLERLTELRANASAGPKPEIPPATLAKLRMATAESTAALAKEFGIVF